MEKRFLVVVDMQNDFIDGSLGTKEALEIVPNVIQRIREAKENGETVIATLDTHGEEYLSTSEGKKLPVRHCIRGTEGHKIREDVLSCLDGALMLEKPSFGSLRLPGEILKLSEGGDFSVELIGLCTDICVVSNALILKANFPENRISVRAECCAGVTPEKHACALETMRSCQIDVY